ncbi:TonB-dependent receptor [Alteromonas sp. 14N.309.X.WAT.G.H12]|uniref:TonB-dependent receptor n=1 Tax=Alteromonas sp. 14N.309.X.WAT.G.H12 TaxID=3120824 RepID=UPI002FD34669
MTRYHKKPQQMSGVLTSCSAILLATSFTAHAQVDESTVAAEDTATDTKPMEIIEVSARKRTESINDVPVAINVFTDDALHEQGISEPGDMFQTSPGIEFDEDGSRGIADFSIRGVEGVTSFFDGMPMSGSQGIASLYDVDAVEIYRGPQSAVFGRSTFAGAVNYSTKDPTDDFESSILGEVGSDGLWRAGVTMSGPINDKLGYFLNYTQDSYDAPDEWVSSDGVRLGAYSSKFYTAKLAWYPTDTVSVELRYAGNDIDDEPNPSYFIDWESDKLQYLTDDPTSLTAKAYVGELDWTEYRDASNIYPRNHFSDNYDNNVDDPGTRNDRDRISLAVDWDLANDYSVNLKSFYAKEDQIYWYDKDNSDIAEDESDVEHWAIVSNLKEYYGEALLAYEGDVTSWHVGLSQYIYDYDDATYSNYNAGTLNGDSTDKTTNTGVFFALFYEGIDNLSLSFEGRYQQDEVESSSASSGASRTKKTPSFLPRFAANWKISPQTNAYFQIAKGTNPGGSNLDNINPTFQETAALVDARAGDTTNTDNLNAFVDYDEEVIWNYEVGFKGYMLGGDLIYNASLYYIDWTDALINFSYDYADEYAVNGGDTDYSFPTDYVLDENVNAGDLSGWGTELNIKYSITDNLNATMGYSHIDIEYDDYCSVFINYIYGVEATGTLRGVDCVQVSGNQQAGQSADTANVALSYEYPMGNGLDWFVRTDATYRSKQYIDELNISWIPSYIRANLRTGLRADNWDVEAYVTNLTDDDTPSLVSVLPDPYNENGIGPGTFNLDIQPVVGRQVGLRMTYNF